MMMQYRMMGASDLKTSAIGFGCWEIGGNYGHFVEQEAIAAIRRAIDLGVTLFDTARGYGWGQSEELLARALGPRRKEVLVVTKGALVPRAGQRPRRDARYQSLIDDCEDSLRFLKTDYLDLFLVHWPDPATPIEESMRALDDLIAAGKARYVGVSNYHPADLRRCRAHAPIVTNQVGYNLFDRRWERQMFPTAKQLGIGIMAYGPLAHGLLTGSFGPTTRFDENDWRARGVLFGQALFQGENFQTNLDVVEQLKRLAADKGSSLPRLALAWVLANPQVAVALTGARQPAEIEDNVAALSITLTAAELAEIDRIMQGAAGQVDELPR
jgi:aryl-alcohol dehydrogenase-like predicted oxidoreductase